MEAREGRTIGGAGGGTQGTSKRRIREVSGDRIEFMPRTGLLYMSGPFEKRRFE